jgi:hypothetical protein
LVLRPTAAAIEPRHGANVFERRLAVTAWSEPLLAAEQDQAAAEVAHVTRKGLDLGRGQIVRRYVAQRDEVVGGEAGHVRGHRLGPPRLDAKRRAFQRTNQCACQPRFAIDHERGAFASHSDECGAGVVLVR